MKKILFIDRDGTLIQEPPLDFQVDALEKLEFLPGVFTYLGKIVREMDFELVLVTNQDGLGTASFPEETFWPAQNKMLQAFENEGIRFREICIDRSFPEDNAPTRKPGIGMLKSYLDGPFDLLNSWVIGDRLTDVHLAQNLGCQSILLQTKPNEAATFTAPNWETLYTFLSQQKRSTIVKRTTKETQIEVELTLEGSGKAEIQTGLRFFDHMLEQIARHGGLDLRISVQGDLDVDEHHTIEDVGIVLGTAIDKALGTKRGIERYGFMLPMDDCIAVTALDFGGRSALNWNAKFKRETIGDMPTEMFDHFFKSFCDGGRCNLYVKAKGKNEHHKIESIFKSFARSLKSAVQKNAQNQLPSTKGLL